MRHVFQSLILVFLLIEVLGQQYINDKGNSEINADRRNLQRDSPEGREGRGRRRKKGPRATKGGKNVAMDKEMIKALQINYPLSIFTDSLDKSDGRNWREPAYLDENLVRESSEEKLYKDIGQAQDQEDVWLYENWFYGMKEGVIMESGALNGLLFSTSLMFEKYANWSAIHVEADPENYAALVGNRQSAVNVHGALCSEPRLLHYSSLGVIPVRGFVEFMSPSFMKKWHGKIYNNKTRIEDLPTVQCLPVKALLRELNVKHIDIWILDTEGAEESVLKGTDFSQVHMNSIAMECDEHDITKNKRKTDIIEANNFKCTLVERNCMCIHNDYKPSSAPELSTLRKWDGQKWTGGYTAQANLAE